MIPPETVIDLATPLVRVTLPGLRTPVPPEKTAVALMTSPGEKIFEGKSKLLITGPANTVTVAVVVAVTPTLLVTVRVYAVVVVGETVIAVPEVTVVLPGVIRPIPLLKTGVRVVEVPAVILAAPAVSEVAIGPGTEPPPPLESPPPPPPPPPQAIPKTKISPRARVRRYLGSFIESSKL